MRSLVIASTQSWDIPFAQLGLATFDVEKDCAYVLSEKGKEKEVFRISRSGPAEDFPVPIATFTANGKVVSFKLLSETRTIAVVTQEGDIGLVSVEDDAEYNFEVIGSIDAGIIAAAWCPDESTVAIVTGDEKLLLMTTSFDVLLEQSLYSDDSGEAQQVNVGWGSKQTQFHGSLGKAAAQASLTSLASVGSSPDDDGQPRVSWRGDGAFFVISSVQAPRPGSDERTRRILRVYNRQGVLQNISEPVAGLEHVLDWRPSGNLISSTQRFGFEGAGAGKAGRHDVVFFERNGLRHGEFYLREQGSYKVRELLWNADSDVLAIWLTKEEGDVVQLWTTGNYHWYLKQEIMAPSDSEGNNKFTSVNWHLEQGMHLLLLSQNRVIECVFAFETFASRAQAPIDTGSVAVADGTSLLITPFRTQNVPPPMASCILQLNKPRTPVHVSYSPAGDHIAVLNHGGSVTLFNLNTRIQFGRGKRLDPTNVCTLQMELDGYEPRQICLQESPSMANAFRVSCLASNSHNDVVVVATTSKVESRMYQMPERDGRLVNSETAIYWQSKEGKIYTITVPEEERPFLVASFPTFCFVAEAVVLSDDSCLFVSRSDSGQLYCTTGDAASAYLLAANTTSMTVSAGFVIYTTAAHEAIFAPLEKLRALLFPTGSVPAEGQVQWERRRVERGSRIVTAVPSNMNLVLQMPRGNLETISPRPMVLAIVEQDIQAKDYRKAFMACRKHRIDLNILVEYDPSAFLENISAFVEQVDDVDFLNLFLTNLGQSSLDPKKISVYCDALRSELELRCLTKYVNTILTAYVVKKPADYEAALSLLLQIRELDSELVEEAVKYVIFLVDADKLFDTALGMYDFSLVLMIAQHSQQDPREYLPFLRELRALPKFYQRFRIDDHLKRYPKALENLRLAGSQYFNEATTYIEKHRLYQSALSLWKDDEACYKVILDLYGDHLFDRREFGQAAVVFVEAQKAPKALIAYERALLWRETLELAIREDVDEDALIDLAHRLADELLSKKKFDDAARVYLDHADNLRQCINALVQGNMFSEARRLITLRREPSLLTEIIEPATLDARSQIAEDLEEMRIQFRKQTDRLRELRIKKEEEPDTFYSLDDDPTLHSVDVMTDVSMAPTAFTRYTVAPTSTSRASRRTSRSKRKMERKMGSGRKGTIDEEEYLLKSLGKLVARFNETRSDATQLIPHLMQFAAEHRKEADSLQKELSTFRGELHAALDEIWPSKPGDGDNGSGNLTTTTSWAERMEEKNRERKRAVESILKPELGSDDSSWVVDIL